MSSHKFFIIRSSVNAFFFIYSIISAIKAFISFFIVMKEIGPARASIGTYVNTAVAVVLGVLILSEPLTLGIIIGLPLVMIGSFLASRKPAANV